MSYENRIALGNLVPTLGQFKVMDKIPQYQQCEVHNLVEAPAEVPEVLRLVGLSDKLNSYPDQLSGGQQQRVSIARAIVNRPPLLICDEPTGNLDPQTSRGIMDLLERINRTGTTVLVATHDREMVDNMRRRVIALDRGHLTRDQDRGVYGFDV